MPRVLIIFLLMLSLPASAQEKMSIDSLRQVVLADSTSSTDKKLITRQLFLTEARKHQLKDDLILAYQQLAAINYQLGRVNEALRYYKLYALELEELNAVEMYRQHQFEKNLYENELRALKDRVTLLEQEKTELKNWKEEYQQATHMISLGLKVVVVIFLLLLAPWLYLKIKNRGKPPVEPASEDTPAAPDLTELLNNTRQHLINAETELDLADILTGQIVPQPDKVFANNFSLANKFLIYQPQQLASGDGLYMAAVQDKTVLAIFDTPQHGATGALLCGHIYHLLDDLVKNHHVISPSLLLTQLEAALHNVFPAGVPFAGGISIGICLIDEKARKLMYAGAQMALYMVYKGVVNKTTGSLTSLLLTDENTTYDNIELATAKGMYFYLSTDGYWLQTGGTQQKPLGEEAFGKTLESLSLQPLAEHEQVLTKIFTDWKGGNDQDDDVLVIGFSL